MNDEKKRELVVRARKIHRLLKEDIQIIQQNLNDLDKNVEGALEKLEEDLNDICSNPVGTRES
jgi:hypothetical protein